MSLQKPSFSPKLPEYLLNESSPKDKYMLEQLSLMSQTQDWLIEETVKQSVKLEEVKEQANRIETQTLKTNGRVTKLEDKNTGDKETDDEVKKIVGAKLFIGKYLLNKYALIGFMALSVGLFRIIDDEGSRQLLLKVLGLG